MHGKLEIKVICFILKKLTKLFFETSVGLAVQAAHTPPWLLQRYIKAAEKCTDLKYPCQYIT